MIARVLGHITHRLAFSTKAGAQAYMWGWSWLRRIPFPTSLVDRIANSAATIAKLVPHRFEGASALPAYTAGGVTVRLVPHPGEFDFGILFRRHLIYEQDVFELIAARIDRYDAVIEIGANVGAFTCHFGKLFQMAGKDVSKIVAFEPSPEAFARLTRNLRENGLTAVRAVQAAIATADGTVGFYEPEGHLTNGSLDRDFAAIFSPTIIQRTVDTVAAARLGEFVSYADRVLIKIDAEGAEPMILTGLLPFVRDRRPDLIVEILSAHSEKMSRTLSSIGGYNSFQITRHGLQGLPISNANDIDRDWLLTPF